MTLEEDLQNDSLLKNNHGAVCTICDLLAELSPKARTMLVARLKDQKGVSAKKISDVLRKNGYEIGRDRVTRHRRGECVGKK